ncbi:hypothetical protein SK069_11145 [Patulibacter brassicae]|uniref:Secreted protein n=1 Tax=Patulibacter brassicae TaxID=1705717 RepID=A0ABU4VJY6_9ACTN|nr:hypothetical protein [Patulibacter brassicae]MDX8152152.1 hypothetical protein [Patulibacter brassicae]
MPPLPRPPRATGTRTALLLVATTSAVALGAPTSIAAVAPAAPCAGVRATVPLSYGVLDEDRTVENPRHLPQGRVGRALASSDGTAGVRTVPAGRRRVPYLCVGDERVARLPVLRAHERVVEATANGTILAWRTATTNTHGGCTSGGSSGGEYARCGRFASTATSCGPGTDA